MDANLFLRSPQEVRFHTLSTHSSLCPFLHIFVPKFLTMSLQLSGLQFTSLEDIPVRVSSTQKSFLEHKTRDVEFRLVQLRKLYWA